MNNNLKPLTRKEILSKICKETELTEKEISKVVDALEQLVIEELQRVNTFKLGNLGNFKVAHVAERTGFNPKTREKIIIPAHITPKFSFSKQIKSALENVMNPNIKLNSDNLQKEINK